VIAGLLRNVPHELAYLARRLRGRPGAPSVSVGEAAALVAAGTPVVDVREPAEWDRGHIEGAIHIPLAQLEGRLAEVPNTPVLTICRSGNRSLVAADLLVRHGRDARSVAGGMGAWHAEVR